MITSTNTNLGRGIRLGICVLAFAALSAVGFTEADACQRFEGFTRFHLSGVGEPPGLAYTPEKAILELRGFNRTDGVVTNMCGTYSGFVIKVANGSGIDQGLRLDVVRGTSPKWWDGDGQILFDVMVDDTIGLEWSENAETNQITYDFDVTATWVDKWGREGATSEPLRIYIPGVEEAASCSQIGGQVPSSDLVVWGVGLVGALVIRRVRK